MNNKVSAYDIDYWQKELPAGSRVRWGTVYGRGTVVETNVKNNINGISYASITVKWDGERYSLMHRGTSMTAPEAGKLKNNTPIKFGTYIPGRTEPYSRAILGDIIEFDGKEYMVKGGIFDGKIHADYLVPDVESLWCHASFEDGIWIDHEDLVLENNKVTLVKAHDPYKGREGQTPDSLPILLRDLQTHEGLRRDRGKLATLFDEWFSNK